MDIAAWYSSLATKWLDLIGDFAGKQKFFVEGDSLLFNCFSDPRLDFDPGFQLLHATYLVEKTLADLKRRGAEFDVVFFDNHASFCVPAAAKDPSKYLLARASIIKHLQNYGGLKTVIFGDLANEEFDHAVQESRWAFALCSDGASDHVSPNDSSPSAAKSTVASAFRRTIFKLAQKKIHIALLAGLTYQDSKVFAFVLDHKHHNLPVADDLTDSLSSLTLPSITEAAGIAEPREPDTLPYSASLRLRLTYSALSSGLLAQSEPQYKIATLIQAVYLEILPVTDRCFESIAFSRGDEQQLQNFTSLLSRALLNGLERTAITDLTVIDLLDGRLLRITISDLRKMWNDLPQEWAEKVQQIISHIGIRTTDLTNQASYAVAKRAAIIKDDVTTSTITVLPFSTPVFGRHLSALVLTERAEQKEPHVAAIDTTAWQVPTKGAGPKILRPHDGIAYNIMLRRQQRAFAQLTVYAQSLAGGTYDPRLIVVEKPAKGKATTKDDQATKAPKMSKKAQELIEANKKRLEAKKPVKKSSSKVTAASMRKSVVDQLVNDGPLFKRGQAAQDDIRVDFKPDPWQVKVLNELDAGNSLLLVAPTSSGKTFVSFYAMEKVLRASDDGVLVYIAPTKALVNQIAAEVMGRFKKNYQGKNTPSISLVSILTRDVKVNHPTKSQILVTVPSTLQSLLLNPINKSWATRIKAIIFDEVHSMASTEDSLVWEQLIVGSSCQMIALSATVGNLSTFSKWLSSTRAGSEKRLKLIQHDQRWSDLRKYMFVPPTSTGEQGLGSLPKRPDTEVIGLDKVQHMTHVHPAASLLNAQNGTSSDLDLESRDCLTLWRELKAQETAAFPVPAELDPEKFFCSAEIVKDDIARWGKELKLVLDQWMAHPDSPLPKVQKSLSDKLVSMPKGSFEDVLQATMPLLRDLHGNGSLPAIIFNFNRKECEDIAVHILEQLEEDEEHFKSGSVSWKRKLEKFTLWQAAQGTKKLQSDKQKKKTQGDRDDKTSRDERGRDSFTSRDEAWQSFNPDAPLDGFSFANIVKSDPELLESTLDDFDRVGISPGLIRAFQRGIGVHHSGMNKWYRHAVEIFFRRGFLTVVFATSTLSLGINMPAKTVVFAGDSVHLTALNYRQCSGRAGRRGFDLLGNVVFQNVSTDRVLQLMSSALPDIKGHFTMTTTFLLRLLSLLHGTGNASYAVDMVDALLSRTHLYQQSERFKQQVLYHVRFSIEYLRAQGLLDANGKPLGLAPLVSALHMDEKGAFAFHALLRDGYFFDLARQHAKAQDHNVVLEKLMFTLSHLFKRRVMRQGETEDEQIGTRTTVSTTLLKPLPKTAADILQRHNEQVLVVYKNYAASYAAQHCHTVDSTLPLSQVEIKPAGGMSVNASSLSGPVSPAAVRSPFVALSGHGDSFDSIADLCETVRGEIFLEKSSVPYLETCDTTGVQLNSYLYDFFRSGSVRSMVEGNRIPPSDVWYVLGDFSTTLFTIVKTLEHMVLAPGEQGEDDFGGEDDSDDEDGFPNGNKAKKVLKDDSDDEEWDSEDPTMVSSGSSSEDDQAGDLKRDMQALLAMFRHLEEEFKIKFKRMWA